MNSKWFFFSPVRGLFQRTKMLLYLFCVQLVCTKSVSSCSFSTNTSDSDLSFLLALISLIYDKCYNTVWLVWVVVPSVQDCHNEALKDVCLLIHYSISTVLILQQFLELFVLSLPCVGYAFAFAFRFQWKSEIDLSKTKMILVLCLLFSCGFSKTEKHSE